MIKVTLGIIAIFKIGAEELLLTSKNNNLDFNEYSYYDVYDCGGILMGINLTPYSPFDHFPSYDEVYDLIKDNLEKN